MSIAALKSCIWKREKPWENTLRSCTQQHLFIVISSRNMKLVTLRLWYLTFNNAELVALSGRLKSFQWISPRNAKWSLWCNVSVCCTAVMSFMETLKEFSKGTTVYITPYWSQALSSHNSLSLQTASHFIWSQNVLYCTFKDATRSLFHHLNVVNVSLIGIFNVK